MHNACNCYAAKCIVFAVNITNCEPVNCEL
jgi:hypothetical protein